jgi:hypothetical protein
MNKWMLFLFIFGLWVPASASQKKVFVIGIDGTMPSAMAVARTPNLDYLKSNGCYSVRAVTHPVTHSAACWTSFFTGVWGDKHGVNDPGNSFSGNRLSEYPSFFKHLKVADPSLQTLCFARWSPLLTVVPDADVKQAFDSDAAITLETCRRLTNSNPDVLYMILLDVDSAGHTYGWGAEVAQYVKAIETADTHVGEIITALQSRPTYSEEDWLVIVLTDHGQHDHPDPERSRITFHIVSGRAAGRGVIWPAPAIVDLCSTVLTHMGVPIDKAWKLDARLEGLAVERAYFDTNLIYNGDAEANSGANSYATNRGIAWWNDLACTTLGIYGGNTSFPDLNSPGPDERRANFFVGGTTNSLVTQQIDLTSISAKIDSAVIGYTLTGWLGGTGSQDDAVTLTAAFLDAEGNLIGTNRIGPVEPLDRGGVTRMLRCEANGSLPRGCRFIDFSLSFTSVTSPNSALADNLSFILHDPRGPFAIEQWTAGVGSFSVQFSTVDDRNYVLQRSVDLGVWEDITAPQKGMGNALTLKDSKPPVERAYYRVRESGL